MKRIAIVGHPSSGYSDAEALLQHHGLAHAAPSRKEGMRVEEIQSTLLKNHNAPSITQARKESQLSQIMPSTVWQGLALDFLLGNIDQETVWGWAAPETLLLLDMWHQLDEQTMFMLVYQSPAAALQQALTHQADINPDECLDNWAVYHGAMLAFYLRHPERCVLANTQQLLSQPEALLKVIPDLSGQQSTSSPIQGSTQATQKESVKASRLENYLHNQICQRHPAQNAYEELQASAFLPSDVTSAASEKDAWLCYKQSSDGSQQLEEENSLLLQQLQLVQEELEKLYTSGKASQASHSPSKSYYGADDRIKRQLTYRLGAVVVNSHSITDFIFLPFALKRAHSAYKKDVKAKKGEQLPPIAHYADAHKADQVKQHLSYRLGQVIMANAGSPIGWFRLPFALSREAKAFRRERQR